MLSSISEPQYELFSCRHDRRHLKGTVHPGPEITIGEQVIPEQGDKVRDRPVEPGTEHQVLEKKDGDQCCPDLDHDGICRRAHKGLYLEVLLYRLGVITKSCVRQ